MDALTPINVLISLHKGYGLGDSVQMSVVLKHVSKYRPEWIVDYQAEEGKYQVGRGIVANAFAYGTPYPHAHYDAEVLLTLFDTWHSYSDRPNTHVSSCLRQHFGLDWDTACGRYQVDVSDISRKAVQTMLWGCVQKDWRTASRERMMSAKYVAVHYNGDSSQAKKNLTHKQAEDICDTIERLGYIPLILDWRNRSSLPFRRITSPERWGGDAEMVCAIISQCVAFVGIDSGPAKCASATDTPALVIWTGHHPAPFHDPAPNTTHLVPHGYHGLDPVCNDQGVIQFFEQNYRVQQYERDPVGEVVVWLKEVLG